MIKAKRHCNERNSLGTVGGRRWCGRFIRSMQHIRWVYLIGFTCWTPAGARLELMVIVNVVNVVLEERTAPSHVLMHTRWYKAGKEPSIAMGMTSIRLLMIYIGRVTKWRRSSGTWHSMRWHQPMVTALIREVLPRYVKGVEISPANLMGRVHPVTVILLCAD